MVVIAAVVPLREELVQILYIFSGVRCNAQVRFMRVATYAQLCDKLKQAQARLARSEGPTRMEHFQDLILSSTGDAATINEIALQRKWQETWWEQIQDDVFTSPLPALIRSQCCMCVLERKTQVRDRFIALSMLVAYNECVAQGDSR